mmetsp:Transcript_40784/g.64193  ORF Transcript_40784/g.64193 Transcript_40784/m.64193 type:complete len:224 (-) Transcript_40784:103-774(-)
MATLFYPVLALLLLPATADLDFGKAAQKLIDKIESGDRSLPVLKQISPMVKENLRSPPETLKPMTARDPLDALPKVSDSKMPKAFAKFPQIDFDEPVKKSVLSKAVADIVKKEQIKDTKRLKAALARLSKVYEKQVGPDGFALIGKPLRLNEDVQKIESSSSTSVAGLCVVAGVAFIGLGLVALRTGQGANRTPVVSDCEDVEAVPELDSLRAARNELDGTAL